MESGSLKEAKGQRGDAPVNRPKSLTGTEQTIAKKAAPWFLADLTVVAASKTDAYPSTSSPADAKAKQAAEQVK
jgi:hypothetical protein